MEALTSLSVRQESRDSLVIDGLDTLPEAGIGELWQAHPLAEGRVLLRLRRGDEPKADYADEPLPAEVWGSMPVETLSMVLAGLHADAWSGVILIDTGFGAKKIYLREGALIFAASSAMDDRLGEVIYRDGLISLDDLTQSTAKVTRSTRFGQVLIGSGVFDSLALWKALCLQVRQIVSSLFMVDTVYVEAYPGQTPSTEVAFPEGTKALFDSCYAFGMMFRNFSRRLRSDATVRLVDTGSSEEAFYPQGTFMGDFLTLLRENNSIGKLLTVSKVQAPYTLAALMLLINRGVCELSAVDEFIAPSGRPFLLPLRSRLNAYQYLLQETRKAFAREERDFPTQGLADLAWSFNEGALPVFYLTREAELDAQSLAHIYSQCLAVKSRVAIFAAFVDCLIGFLLQLADDLLSPPAAARMRDVYHKIGSL